MYFYSFHTLTRSFIGLLRQIDRCILLQRQDAQLQFLGVLRQAPQTIQERPTILEMVCYQFSVGIKAGTVTLVICAPIDIFLSGPASLIFRIVARSVITIGSGSKNNLSASTQSNR